MFAMKRSCSHTFPVGSSKSGCQCRVPATEKVMGQMYCFVHARLLRRAIEWQRRSAAGPFAEVSRTSPKASLTSANRDVSAVRARERVGLVGKPSVE
jgi:hypothetical protein